VSATVTDWLHIVYYVQGFVANHEQGRVNRIKFSKEQRAVFQLTLSGLLHRPKQAFSQEEYFGKFIMAPLTNAKRVFRKTQGRSAKNLCSIYASDFNVY